jgi:hypothetical protein
VIEEIDGREVDVERMKAVELATCSTGGQAKVLEELDDRTNRSRLYVEEGEDYVVVKTARVLNGGKPKKQAAVNFVEKFVRNSFARGDPRCVHKNRVTRGKRSSRGLCSRCKLQGAVYLRVRKQKCST